MNAPATTKELGPVSQFGNFLEKFKPQLKLALPAHMNADRMARLALTAFSTSPALQACEPRSIAAALMTAGQLGLEPGVNGAGFLIPYKTTCTFVPGWKGLVDLVSRSGRGTVYTGVIFKDQEYTFIDGAKRDLIIHNETDLDAPEDITHAFAIGWVKDAAMPIIELWTVAKIRKHRDKYNKVGAKHYSFRDWEMYCRKVPLLQVLKYMPSSIELSNAIAVSNAAEAGHGATIDGFGVVVEEGDGDSEGAGNSSPEFYPQDQFDAELTKTWAPLLASGKKKPEQVIGAMRTKHPLSDDQIKAVHALVKKAEQSDAEKLIEKMRATQDPDTLAAHADLINTLPEADRENVTAIYRQRKAELSQ